MIVVRLHTFCGVIVIPESVVDMAERRMFAKTIIDSDAFIEMPISARLLYYDLGMRADDDGFVNSPKKIMRMIGATIDDMNILIMRKFIIPFDSGVVVIKHWRINNYLRSDRYTETQYVKEREQLTIDDKGKYHLGIPTGTPTVSTGKDSIGKDRIGKNNNNDAIRDVVISYSLSDVLTDKIFEWLDYKKEKKQTYKPRGLQTLLNKVKDVASVYGDDPVCEVIDKAMMSNYSGFFLDNIPKYCKPVEHIVIESKGGGRE